VVLSQHMQLGSVPAAVNKKIEPSLRNESNVFERTDSMYHRSVCCC